MSIKLLSIESSAKSASVALTEDGRLLGQYYQNTGLTHSRTLLPMAEDLLKNLELAPGDIDAFAVAIGPGSFTGIRIGVATVKGMAFALEKPCYGVSTLEAMAYGAPPVFSSPIPAPTAPATSSHRKTLVCPVMDARRNQVYNALFHMEGEKIVRLTEDRAISLENLFEETQNNQLLLVGDGAELCNNWLSQKGVSVTMLPENIRFQSAWGVAKAAEKTEPCTAHDLTPCYIRMSQAERLLLDRDNK